VLGPNGFGVVIKGTSMLHRGINDGDIVWIDPDQPYACGDVVLAFVCSLSGKQGLAVKIIRGEYLEDVECREFHVIGPAVLLTRSLARARSC